MKTSWIKIVLLSFAFAAVPTMPSLAFQEKFDDSTGALEIIGHGPQGLGVPDGGVIGRNDRTRTRSQKPRVPFIVNLV